MSHTSLALLALVLSAVAVETASAGTFGVRDVRFTYQNVQTSAPGETSGSVTSGNYSVGPGGLAFIFERAIVPFPRTRFTAIADGRPILGARLRFRPAGDFAEAGEVWVSEARLFTTSETDLLVDNADVFAALTGDGGPYTVIGPVVLTDGERVARAIEFEPAAVAALDAAIHGGDPTIGIALREYAGNDVLDEFFFGIPPGVMTLEVDAPAVAPPRCDVESAAAAYGNGDAVVLSHLRFTNPDPVTIAVRIRLELDIPGIGTVDALDIATPALPGPFDRDLGPAQLFEVVPSMPRGVWGVRCAIEDLESGDLLVDDATSFTVQ